MSVLACAYARSDTAEQNSSSKSPVAIPESNPVAVWLANYNQLQQISCYFVLLCWESLHDKISATQEKFTLCHCMVTASSEFKFEFDPDKLP